VGEGGRRLTPQAKTAPAAATLIFCRVDCATRAGARAAFEPLTDITQKITFFFARLTRLAEKTELVAGWS